MKYLISVLLLVSCASAIAQKESFDLASYTKPAGWTKNPTEDAVQFVKEDAARGTYCVITLYKAMPSVGDPDKNFDVAWESILKEVVTISTEPDTLPSANEDGWDVHSGYAPFDHDGTKGMAMLVTATGYKKMVNVIILTNTDAYEKNITAFLESMSLKKPLAASEPPAPATNATESNASITGIWGISSSGQTYFEQNHGISGYTKRQYNFNANGTYVFYVKVFSYLNDKLIFVKETGTYQLSGNNLTVTPQKNVFETWTKDSVMSGGRKSGTDKWGRFVSRQSLAFEKKSYQVVKHYFSHTQKWALILQTNEPTIRDGTLSNTTEYGNAYLYDAVTSDIFLVDLPKGR